MPYFFAILEYVGPSFFGLLFGEGAWVWVLKSSFGLLFPNKHFPSRLRIEFSFRHSPG